MKTDWTQRLKQTTYPAEFHQLAGVIGYARLEMNRQMTQRPARFDRGEANLRVEVLGVWAELVFGYFLESMQMEFQAAPLLDRRPVKSWDFHVDTMGGIDAKGVNPWDTSLLINYEAYNKGKQTDWFAFVQETAVGKARIFFVRYAEVGAWQVQQAKFSQVYAMPIKEILRAAQVKVA